MTLGFYDSERRYRRRVWTGFIKFFLFVIFVLGVGLFSYQMGVEQVKEHDFVLREEVSQLSRQKGELELLASQLQDAARSADARALDLETRLNREVPKGELARLSQMVAERLTSGVSGERLAFVISQAQNRRNCQPAETKRLQASTPIYKSPNRSVSFAGGTITVVGEGQSVRDAQGNSEGWFDPGQPVTLHVTPQGGKESSATGLLPLHHSLVIDNVEYRFTAVAGSRSFLEVTTDRCTYP
jgi:FtsZ-binding cell division protein ZapB